MYINGLRFSFENKIKEGYFISYFLIHPFKKMIFKKKFIFILISVLFFSLTPLISTNQCPYSHNDTIISDCCNHKDIMKYLKGSWDLKGSWRVVEGEGKGQSVNRAKILGTETYTPILEGHFLRRDVLAKVSYFSKDQDKKVIHPFSNITFYTYNTQKNKFFFWYFDSSGSFMDAEGSYDLENNLFSFHSKGFSGLDHQEEIIHTLRIIDDNHFEWSVKERINDNSWGTAASGISTRLID